MSGRGQRSRHGENDLRPDRNRHVPQCKRHKEADVTVGIDEPQNRLLQVFHPAPLLERRRSVSGRGAPQNFGGRAAAFQPQRFEQVERPDLALAGPLLSQGDDPPNPRAL